jgi:nucleotide-binding universal stress UspA family protein
MKTAFDRILVGVDGSEPSLQAIRLAVRLAREHHGRVILCHAVDWLTIVAQTASASGGLDVEPIIAELRQLGRDLIASAAATARAAGVEVDEQLLEGKALECLLCAARDRAATMYVLGTRGNGPIGRAFLGSTTDAVLRQATIPVLTVRGDTMTTPETRRTFGRLLVGIDDGAPAQAALRFALDLPAEDRAEILIYGVDSSGDEPGLEHAEHIVERAVITANAHDTVAHGHTLEGSPGEELVAAAKDEAVDAIVVGSHGRKGLQRLILGSVAEYVVRMATVPVLVVRESAAVASAIPLRVRAGSIV